MKQQTAALLLSALLLSTFGHDHHLRSHHGLHSRKASHLTSRDNSSEDQCGWVCPKPDGASNATGELTVVVNQTSTIIAVVNTTAQVAGAIDISANLVAVFNGSSGAVVVIDIEKGSGVYIAAGVSQKTWLSSHQSFDVFINGLASLKVVFELGQKVGVSFQRASVSKAILEEIASVLIHLSVDISVQLKVSVSEALNIVLDFSTRVTALFKGSLKGFFSLVSSVVVAIQGDLKWLVGVLEGLGEFFAQIQGGIKILIDKSIKLDLQAILVAKSGIDVFVYLVTELSAHLDISAILGGVFKSIDNVLALVVKLGGNISLGLNGLLKVVIGIMALIRGEISIEVVINALIEFSITEKTEISISEQWSLAIKSILQLVVKINTSGSLDALVKLLKDIQDNKFKINGVDISAIISILVQVGSIAALDLIVGVLLLITTVVKAEIAIPALLFSLISRLNTTIGLHVVLKIVPSIKIDSNIDISANPLQIILKGVSLSSILGLLTGKGSGIPVIGDIMVALAASVKVASHGSLKLSVLLQSGGGASLLNKFKGLWQSCNHSSGGVHGGILGGIHGGLSLGGSESDESKEHHKGKHHGKGGKDRSHASRLHELNKLYERHHGGHHGGHHGEHQDRHHDGHYKSHHERNHEEHHDKHHF